ncbi:DUF1845 domain-containing protein [Pseudoduganella violacea]|uniref:DUF1845 domain-containing protein n=1 Tax=Pseudoduganella violacea TaxID=1715466 RepID=A0A7W5FWV4_9BURK|nr:DUF1845 domain-containing protein [Pseudoduganella violacea]MBB3122197.1 hypothetical protein [Pseudoduganella violacea]
MPQHALSPIIVRRDHGAANRKLIARQANADFARVESASRKIGILLSSPEGKRLYLRCFDVTQMNFHFISVFARLRLADDDIGKVEQELRTMLDTRLNRLNRVLADVEAKCHAHGILNLASYDVEPLNIEAKVFSMLGRRLLEMIGKVDQLMPMLETLCIDEAMSTSQLSLEKARIKNTVRSAASTARTLRLGLERRIAALQNGDKKAAIPATPALRPTTVQAKQSGAAPASLPARNAAPAPTPQPISAPPDEDGSLVAAGDIQALPS